jgi:DNA topoisomerase I
MKLAKALYEKGLITYNAIASGDKSWQPYLCEWNRTYFSPALAKAKLQIPESTNSTAKGITTLTEYLCPVCQKQLERYDYTKEKQAKSLLRCSDIKQKLSLTTKTLYFS